MTPEQWERRSAQLRRDDTVFDLFVLVICLGLTALPIVLAMGY